MNSIWRVFLADHYKNSTRNLFLLDYDGTLAEFTIRPENARLTNAQYQTLLSLAHNPRNTVVIVSGRDHHTLEAWLGDLPISIAAEYGHFIKEHGKDWKVQAGRDDAWKPDVRPVLESLVAAVPGSFIEEKDFSLVWHYSGTDEAFAKKALKEKMADLKQVAGKHKLVLKPAVMDFEVAVPGIDKSIIANYWLERDDWDFILAAGDDVADEVLFEAVPKNVVTVKIGKGESAAKYRLPNPQAFSRLLQRFNALG